MKNTPKKPGGWSAVRKHLVTCDLPTLIALLKDLYEISAENRNFIHARCLHGEPGSDVFVKYLKKIEDQFFPDKGFGKLKLGEARKAIRDYHKATGNAQGTAELLMTFVENGTDFTITYGDINVAFYNSVDSVLIELADLLRREPQLYPQFRERLDNLLEMADGISWGFHDCTSRIVGELKDEFDDDLDDKC